MCLFMQIRPQLHENPKIAISPPIQQIKIKCIKNYVSTKPVQHILVFTLWQSQWQAEQT